MRLYILYLRPYIWVNQHDLRHFIVIGNVVMCFNISVIFESGCFLALVMHTDNLPTVWNHTQTMVEDTITIKESLNIYGDKLKDICHGRIILYMCWGLSLHIISSNY